MGLSYELISDERPNHHSADKDIVYLTNLSIYSKPILCVNPQA